MATLTHSSPAYTTNSYSRWRSAYTNFVNKAEFNRFGWAATAAIIQGCLLSPVLLLTLFYYGGSDWQFLASNLSFLMVLIPILSAMHVKYIFPTFGISFILHVTLILYNVL
ncbi:hypothetical protein M0L20_05635 [Spirosoma sp. RP8]|uniref:Uncharacterized protein n=1 Tax=Spirosoma liriopis TaxID=2937440 RepID=A0ABT0HGQ5_9BACT|nr:hypothetical protein [Spirosoma liriopis]MCK8491324.1 hypothetical protein [Spirosoma liriopis]